MRFHEFLLEYKQDVTLKNYGDRLFNKAINDPSIATMDDPEFYMDPDNYDRFMSITISSFESADPTDNKQYTEWLVRSYINDTFELYEDVVSTAAEFLHKFHTLRVKRKVPAELADVNRIKTYQTFIQYANAIQDLYSKYNITTKLPKGNVEFDKTLQDSRVIVPADQEAACYYGQNTQWCTAATHSENAFDDYASRGELIIIIPKRKNHIGEKYQIHFADNMFMDENDNDVSIDWLLNQRFASDLKELILNSHPNLKKKLIFTHPAVVDDVIYDIVERVRNHLIKEINNQGEYEDPHYQKYITSKYGDDEGIVDWSDLEDDDEYANYNPKMQDYLNTAIDTISLDSKAINGILDKYADSGDDILDYALSNISEIMAYNIQYDSNAGRFDYRDLIHFLRYGIMLQLRYDDEGDLVSSNVVEI